MRTAFQVALAVGLVSGCAVFSDQPRRVTVNLNIDGTVLSATDGSVIAGATVTLGSGGRISFPVPLKTVQTTAAGQYAIQHALTYSEGFCPFLWVTAEAAGYVTSSIENSQSGANCLAQLQTIDIALQPVP